MTNPFDYLPDIGDAPDDWSEWEALSANPSSASVTNAWHDVGALLTPAQREAAMHSGSALVLAGAGTGKTSTLTEAHQKGYVGESCPDCGNFTMVRNGTCLKCDTCGSTTGCS